MNSTIVKYLLAACVCWTCTANASDTTFCELLKTRDWESIVGAIELEEIKLDPVVGKLVLGHAYVGTNKNDQAYSLFLSANNEDDLIKWTEWTHNLHEHCEHAVSSFLLGDALARQGEVTKAIQQFTDALQEAPSGFPLARNARGVAYAVNQDLDSAVVDFYVTTKNAPGLAEAWVNLGNVAVLREASAGQSDTALGYFEKALEINPDYSFAYNGRGCLQFGRGKFDLAAQDFHIASLLNPGLLIAEVNEGFALSYQFQLANIDGTSEPGSSFSNRIKQQRTSIESRRMDLLAKPPNQEFVSAITNQSIKD